MNCSGCLRLLCLQVDGGSLPSALPVEKGMKVLPRELDGDGVRGIQEVRTAPSEIAEMRWFEG